MPLGPEDDRRFLTTDGAPMQARQIVGCRLERVQEIVQVLDVAYRAQAAHGRADRLAEDCCLSNAGISEPQVSVFCLQALENEVHIAKLANVLADYEQARVTREVGVKVAKQNLPAVDARR